MSMREFIEATSEILGEKKNEIDYLEEALESERRDTASRADEVARLQRENARQREDLIKTRQRVKDVEKERDKATETLETTRQLVDVYRDELQVTRSHKTMLRNILYELQKVMHKPEEAEPGKRERLRELVDEIMEKTSGAPKSMPDDEPVLEEVDDEACSECGGIDECTCA